MTWVRFLANRILQMTITLMVVSAVVFLLARASGSPVDLLLPLEATQEQRVAFSKELGLDRPVYAQYGTFVGRLLRGEFGVSLRAGVPVWEVVRPALINSVKLALVAISMSIALGIPLGVAGALYRNHAVGKIAMGFATLGQSLPAFAVGVSLVLFFSVALNVLPAGGTGSWKHYVLPGFTLGWFVTASVARLLRSQLLDVQGSEFVKFARANGVSQRSIVWKHMMKNSLSPVITLLAFSSGMILAVSVTAEVVFSWPGVGTLAYQAVLWRDFPLLEFLVLLFAAVIVITSFVADVLYFILDPRIRV